MTDVSLLVAFAAGLLALLSPCSALLLPAFFAYAFEAKRTVVARTAVFYLGLITVLVPLGIGSRLMISLVYAHRHTTIAVAAGIIVTFGVLSVLGIGFAIPGTSRLQQSSGRRSTGVLATYALGAVYGLAGFCAGPVLGAILTMAATTQRPIDAALVLAAYALGMVVPLLLLAIGWERLGDGGRHFLRGRGVTIGPIETHTTSIISGLLLIGVGVAFWYFDGMVGVNGALGLGDTTDTEISSQRWISDTFGFVPDWSVLVVVALVALAVAVWRMRRPDSPPTSSADRATELSTDDVRAEAVDRATDDARP